MDVEVASRWAFELTHEERTKRLRAERCETCGAVPPNECESRTRNPAAMPHLARLDAAMQTFRRDLGETVGPHR